MHSYAIIRWIAEFLSMILHLTRPYPDKIFSYIYHIIMRPKPLPPIDNKILLMSAKKLAEEIRKRKLKCEEVMQAYVNRAKAVQPVINAITDARYEAALDESRKADRLLELGEKTEDQLKEDTPLFGIPFSVKESLGVKGLAQTSGSLQLKNKIADKDADAVLLYRAAGAIPVVVTNVPEMSLWWDSSNLIFGITRNAYDPSRTVGGSTGGEAALIAAAGSVIGVANEMGGSIRIPAAFNGIYGHKSSNGLRSSIPTVVSSLYQQDTALKDYFFGKKKPKLLSDYLCTGPMCRYVEDLPLLAKILAGDDERLNLGKKVDFRKVKIYYMEEFPGLLQSATPEVKQAVRKAAKYFEDQFEIKTIPLVMDELRNFLYIFETACISAGCIRSKQFFNGVNIWWELIKCIFRRSEHTLPIIFSSMIERIEKDKHHECGIKQIASMREKLENIFQKDAIIIMPTHPEPPPFNNFTYFKFKDVLYSTFANFVRLPATSIPAGLVDGIPIGVQIMSSAFNDHLTIAAAVELHNLFGGWKCPCNLAIK